MLAGLKEGQVHLLRRDENRKVFVSKNDTDIIGWSADEILRNFMDVRSPTDIETVKHLERLQALRQKDALSEEEAKELEHLRHQVNQDLLSGPMASQAERFSDLLKSSREQPESQTKPKSRVGRTNPKNSSTTR